MDIHGGTSFAYSDVNKTPKDDTPSNSMDGTE
jgi:hypothetical protein